MAINKLKKYTKNVFLLECITAIEDLIVKRQPFNFKKTWARSIW